MSAATLTVLLYEPQFVLRRTLASAAKQLRVADIQQAASIEAAAVALQARTFDLIILALDGIADADLARCVQRCGAARIVGLRESKGNDPAPSGISVVVQKPLKVKALLGLLHEQRMVSA